jgi:hypothetical protein
MRESTLTENKNIKKHDVKNKQKIKYLNQCYVSRFKYKFLTVTAGILIIIQLLLECLQHHGYLAENH